MGYFDSCIECTERCVGCHARCKQYQMGKVALATADKKRFQSRILDDEESRRFINLKKYGPFRST